MGFIKRYEAIDAIAVDETIVVSLYDNYGDIKHSGAIGLDIDEAKALYRMLEEAIPKAEESWEKLKVRLGEV